jgi:glycosyltransferase involved in cell wall biosynthesis
MTDQVQPLSVCYFGTYRQAYSRNRIMMEGLRLAGVNVIECHEPLWHGVEDRIQIAGGGWMRPSFWWRVVKAYSCLIRKYRSVGVYDILIVGYPGQYDVFLARWLSWLRHKPLVWDVLNSMYLITVERGIARKHGLTAKLIRFLEGLACRLPDRLILDSSTFVNWFQKTYRIGPERFRLVPIGADEDVFQQVIQEELSETGVDDDFVVLYYGTYIPNHGIDIIVEAANLLREDAAIRFELVGEGPEKLNAVNLVKKYNLMNIHFIDWLDPSELGQKIMTCDVCLGTFGDTLQASLTNNNKIYECFSLQKPVISGISPALPQGLKNGEHLSLCERGNSRSLADAILALKDNPGLRRCLGQNGYQIFHEEFNQTYIGQVFASHLIELLSK